MAVGASLPRPAPKILCGPLAEPQLPEGLQVDIIHKRAGARVVCLPPVQVESREPDVECIEVAARQHERSQRRPIGCHAGQRE